MIAILSPEEQMNNSTVNMLAVLSVLIAVFGTLANALLLTYFLTMILTNSGARIRATTKLFIVLNIIDLLFSGLMAFLFLLVVFGNDSNDFTPLLRAISAVCLISGLFSGFIVCLLAVTRSIKLVLPFSVIKWKVVGISLAVYSVIIVLQLALYSSSYDTISLKKVVLNILLLILTVMFMTVVLSNATSLVRLYCSPSARTEERKTTVTVAIISVIHCVCNMGFIVSLGIFVNCPQETNDSIPIELRYISDYILLLVSSACNPLVYLTRKEDVTQHVKIHVKRHVKTMWSSVAGSFGKTRKHRENINLDSEV